MASESLDNTKPVEETKQRDGDMGDLDVETDERVESAKRLVEVAKKSVEDLMKSVEGEKQPVEEVEKASDGDKDSSEAVESIKEESHVIPSSSTSTPTPDQYSNNQEEDELEGEDEEEPKLADGSSRRPHRPATPIPFSRTSDGTQTPVSQGRISPEEPVTPPPPPRAPRTPPALITRSLPKASEDGLKTPSDISGIWTPSTPRTPGNISSADSIRRKPVPAPSHDNLREGSERASTLRNPLEKTTVTIMPDKLGEKAPSTPDSVPRTHISLPGRRKKAVAWKRTAKLWWVEGAWCGASLLCIVSK